MFSPYSFGNFELLLFASFLIYWCTTYQKLMYMVYNSEMWCVFDLLMKVLFN